MQSTDYVISLKSVLLLHSSYVLENEALWSGVMVESLRRKGVVKNSGAWELAKLRRWQNYTSNLVQQLGLGTLPPDVDSPHPNKTQTTSPTLNGGNGGGEKITTTTTVSWPKIPPFNQSWSTPTR